MKRQPAYRSPPSTLRRLAAHHVFFDFDKRRRTPLPPLASIGCASRGCLRRARGPRCARADVAAEAARALGLRSLHELRGDERRVFADFSPLVLLAGASRWQPDERRSLLR